MKKVLNHFKNEFIKAILFHPIIWILIIIFLISISSSIFFSNSLDSLKEDTLVVYKAAVGLIIGVIQILIIPLYLIVFFLLIDIERQNKTELNYLTLPIRLNIFYILKFVLAYLIYLVSIGIILSMIYFVVNAKIQSLNLPEIEISFLRFYVSHAKHFIILPLTVFLSYFIMSIYIKNYYLIFSLLLILHVLSFLNTTFPNPLNIFDRAINMERSILVEGFVMRFDIKNIYVVGFLYCFVLLSTVKVLDISKKYYFKNL
ncbi:hypothetical protein EGI22_01830 [Lacihabitans sp. LS3-19]|uniref:hypothetical protein n=1 Tax=Lacihabitans sp. LS3-19 TaxID=2487335 RepID=UPI0020CC6197|nr:hypothetical protein [Lacihabitans sp. LS3-19]MCP9766629.1 hypothetical protein [Lacihabitans sp. LS3-19]